MSNACGRARATPRPAVPRGVLAARRCWGCREEGAAVPGASAAPGLSRPVGWSGRSWGCERGPGAPQLSLAFGTLGAHVLGGVIPPEAPPVASPGLSISLAQHPGIPWDPSTLVQASPHPHTPHPEHSPAPPP